MNLLLFLFAIPFAVVIFSIILQKSINSPILIALAFFSIFILIAVITSDELYFILAVVYAILAYIAAIITRFINNIIDRCGNNNQSMVDLNNSIYTSEVEKDSNCYDRDNNEIVINKNHMNRKCWR